MAGIRLLAWLALIGWTCGSVYWHVCRIKQLCDAVPLAVNALKLTGHTDNEGDAADNLALSKQRAQAVQRQFQKRGIPAAQLRAEGRGETEPVASNLTSAGRKANRRVTIVVQ